MTRALLSAGFIAAALAAAMPAAAIELPTGIDNAAQGTSSTPSPRRLAVGAGIAVAPDYEGSDDYGLVPVWNLRAGDLFHPETFVQITGLSLRSNLLADEHFRLGVSGRYLGDYDDVDDSKVNDLDIDDTLLFGLTVGYDFRRGLRNDVAIELDAQYDILEGNGGVLTPRFRWRNPIAQRMAVESTLSATWASEDYLDNRFGIGSQDAQRSGLGRYDADAGFKNATLTGSLSYQLNPAWSVTGLAAFTRMLGDAEDSPVVDDRGEPNQLLGGVLVNLLF
jgi:outer membrane protein